MISADSPREVWFDGDCGVCSAFARWAAARAPDVTFTSYHAIGDEAMARAGVTRAACSEAIQVLVAGRLRACGASGIVLIGRWAGLPGARLASAALTLRPIRRAADGLYAAFARRRAAVSWLMGISACRIH